HRDTGREGTVAHAVAAQVRVGQVRAQDLRLTRHPVELVDLDAQRARRVHLRLDQVVRGVVAREGRLLALDDDALAVGVRGGLPRRLGRDAHSRVALAQVAPT